MVFSWFFHGFSKVSAGELSRGGDPAKASAGPLEDWENNGRFHVKNRETF